MSKKKTTGTERTKAAPAASGSKAARTRAATAANPVATKDVTAPSKAPKAAEVSTEPVPRLPFRRPQPFTFAGVGRNDICPCGSGKKFKNCHGH